LAALEEAALDALANVLRQVRRHVQSLPHLPLRAGDFSWLGAAA
jgi:hypothetical protein